MRAVLGALCVFAAVVHSAPAMATTADAVCSISDSNVKFESSSAVGSSMGGPWHLSSLNGEMEVRASGVPPGLRAVTLKHEELAHHWRYGRDLKLHIALVRPGAKHQVEVELVIETRSAKAGSMDYSGSYVLLVREEQVSTFRGRAKCRIVGE